MKKAFLLILLIGSLAGCAVSTRYVGYTDQKFQPKSKYYFVTVYYDTQRPPVTNPYYVIGKVEVSGYTSDGVNPDSLLDKAKAIARKKGADAIVNARTEAATYSGMNVIGGYTVYHRHWASYHPATYVPYTNTLLTFRGELIAFTLAPIPASPEIK